jgi:integrase/recombinase XerC
MDRLLAFPSASALIPADVALLDPEEHVYKAMVEGWKRQQQSRALRNDTIAARLKLIDRLHFFTNAYPWQWTPQDFVDFSAHVWSDGRLAVSTLRQYQCAIRLFMEYITDPRYAWSDECARRFGTAPVQICDEWNTTEHSAEFEGRPERRPLTFDEVQALFDYADSRCDSIKTARKKGSLSAFRDSVIYKVAYAYGLRRREVCRLELADFHSNPAVKQYGRYGAVHVRYGKGVKGSPPRRRIVLTVPEFDWVLDVIQQYIEEIRPRFNPGRHPALFVTEGLGFMHPIKVGARFNDLVAGAGLPSDLELHCLRHSYSTHLAEYGYDPLFIQEQLGHTYASTTAIHTHVSNDFKNRKIVDALARLYKKQRITL